VEYYTGGQVEPGDFDLVEVTNEAALARALETVGFLPEARPGHLLRGFYHPDLLTGVLEEGSDPGLLKSDHDADLRAMARAARWVAMVMGMTGSSTAHTSSSVASMSEPPFAQLVQQHVGELAQHLHADRAARAKEFLGATLPRIVGNGVDQDVAVEERPQRVFASSRSKR
jgi:hypothetical protein